MIIFFLSIYANFSGEIIISLNKNIAGQLKIFLSNGVSPKEAMILNETLYNLLADSISAANRYFSIIYVCKRKA